MDLFWGVGLGWRAVDLWGIVVGRFKCGKMGDHQNVFFMNNSVDTLTPFNEEHQFLLKLHYCNVRVGMVGVSVWREDGAMLCCIASRKSNVSRELDI